jgi:hypothetical protein
LLGLSHPADLAHDQSVHGRLGDLGEPRCSVLGAIEPREHVSPAKERHLVVLDIAGGRELDPTLIRDREDRVGLDHEVVKVAVAHADLGPR